MWRPLDLSLKRYAQADYVTRLKAQFILYMGMALLIILPLNMAFTAYINLHSPGMGYRLNLPVLLTEAAVFVLVVAIVHLVNKGSFAVASHLLIIVALIGVWTVMAVDRSKTFTRLDSIVHILALMSMAPLVVSRRKASILVYVIGNIIALLVFIAVFRPQLDLADSAVMDYVLDTTSAMIFIGIVTYNVFAINKQALDRATADIAARREAEEELSYKNVLLAAQTEASADGILFVDDQRRVILNNRRFRELWGLPPEIIATRSDDRYLDYARRAVRDPEAYLRQVHDLYNRQAAKGRDEIPLTDGRTLERYSEPVQGPTGEYLGRVWHFRDISARKEAEENLRASEERYRAVVEDQTEMIVRFTPGGVITFANGAAQRYFHTHQGFSGEHLGRNIRDFIRLPDDDVVQSYLPLLTPDQPINDLEYALEGRDGQARWTIWTARALYNDQGETEEYQAVGRDITAQKQADQERERLEEQLRQAQKMESIGRLAGGIAHDFNNLLTAISGNIQLALMDLKGNKPPQHRLQEASKAADSAAALTRQLLAFSRKQIIEPKILDLNEIIAQLSKLLTRVIGEDITLHIDITRPVGRIKADPVQLEQILVNLAVNARDAMPNGGTLTIETADVVLDEFYCRQHANVKPGPYVLLALSDTGVGMDAEIQRHLFEPFFTTKPKGKGTGLGLATIYGAVTQNGANITVYSAPGQGTTFKIYFPCVPGEVKPAQNIGATEDLPQGSETILLVEDEPQVLEFAQTILTRLGYTVIPYASAEEALARLPEKNARAIPLLMTDVVLPGMNGRMLATEITALNPSLKVLFTSGYAENVIVHHGVLEEGIHFIGKPYTAGPLARKIREILDA